MFLFKFIAVDDEGLISNRHFIIYSLGEDDAYAKLYEFLYTFYRYSYIEDSVELIFIDGTIK